ncbi:uncharacterized protein BDR25DRAFT_359551 [Lindgomyces ingoldianus]|uniref:Uncharacterized protein n=1 Tax=Lindgomyces ingoldianus TaxID=673940 RepID=A0ACB6QI82_9PLEO|nr:uncharacterized protein BDR25DRAFT_359551 [Lindgomyces ingoldianus]KAF2466644.1 hypothetical protein BDR25DRAFT_359551 [Lindgomyces ingoldianus]
MKDSILNNRQVLLKYVLAVAIWAEEGTYGKRLDKGARSKQGGMSVFAVHGYDIAFDEVNTEAKLYKEK